MAGVGFSSSNQTRNVLPLSTGRLENTWERIKMSLSLANFQMDLDFSHRCEDFCFWEEIYNNAFPNNVGIHSHRQDGPHQRNGVDRSVILDNGKSILIDEKSRRRKDTGDILLEFLSNDRMNTPGWVEKPLMCDYIAYAFLPSGNAYLLPVLQLQLAWSKNKEHWKRAFKVKKALNEGYATLSTPVPTQILFREIGQCLRVKFKPIGESLP
jgi:hypothetical protein